MAARFFLHGDHHLAKVVPSGTPLLRPGQYHRTFLERVVSKYVYCMFLSMQIQGRRFHGYIIIDCIK